uniref:SIS domain-containing protein n=1 Tax=Algoriphagus sp. TaxID=1872435 RepID=UPI0040489A15
MLKNYHNNYFDSIYRGLNQTSYFFENNKVDSVSFFLSIKEVLTNLNLNKGKIFFLGNGASSAFANHMALDFSKNGKILSRSLSDSALLTALSNDYSYEKALVEYLKIEGVSKEDFVITISSSGNSPNVVSVLEFCSQNEIRTLALSGLKDDNKSVSLGNYSIYVPMKTYGMVECIHQIFLHLILDDFMEILEWERSDFQNMNSKMFKL